MFIWHGCVCVSRQAVAVVGNHDWLACCSPACCHIVSNESHASSSGVIHGLSAHPISSHWFSPQCMWCYLSCFCG